jgi:hypothetical protein
MDRAAATTFLAAESRLLGLPISLFPVVILRRAWNSLRDSNKTRRRFSSYQLQRELEVLLVNGIIVEVDSGGRVQYLCFRLPAGQTRHCQATACSIRAVFA